MMHVNGANSLSVRQVRYKKAENLRANAQAHRGRGASDAFLSAYASVYIYIYIHACIRRQKRI